MTTSSPSSPSRNNLTPAFGTPSPDEVRQERGPGGEAVLMRGIVKRFPGVYANDHVDFDLRRGEIHALLGENGAGKSTLMNILAGLYRADGGSIVIAGQPCAFRSPQDAIAAGIGMVYQHFMLIPSQSVTENVILGLREPRWSLNLSQADQKVVALGKQFSLKVDPRAKIWQLSVGEQQRVEILKMLYRGVQILIMDEPTAVLTPIEVRDLFAILRAMAAENRSIVFISHKLDEVLAIADRITVMRGGKVTAAGLDPRSVNKSELARLMVGRDIEFQLERLPYRPSPVVLDVQSLEAASDKQLPALRGINLQVHSGEIVGIAGVAGNGQTELAEVITGLRPKTAGQVLINGQALKDHDVLQAINTGVGHVPEDRSRVGTAPTLGIADNLIMKSYRRPPIASGWRLNRREARAQASQLKDDYAIAAPSLDTEARLLSGGNLQRLILARETSAKPSLLVAVHPTRGLDVGATEAVLRLLIRQRDAGAALLLISEDLDEIMSVSDRVAVMYEGRISAVMETRQANTETIGLLMGGSTLSS
ncbi:MAG: ABC transporter ATP-binding protein [Chloroflexi bacterium]|nr:ABC transporter ATP-binding protein [Chloroflexota bacterium]